MLKIYSSLSDIDFRQLMTVYEEGNRRIGKELYADQSENLQLLFSEQDFYTYLNVFFFEPTSRYAVWMIDGVYVSALRFERYDDGILLNALETTPSKRCNGFATNLMRSVLSFLQCGGIKNIYSHVEKSNNASLRLHLSCGFRIISDSAKYLDGTLRTDSYTLLLNE